MQEVVAVEVVAMQEAGAVAGAVAGEYYDGRTLGRTQQRWNTSPVPESSSLMSSACYVCVWCNTNKKLFNCFTDTSLSLPLLPPSFSSSPPLSFPLFPLSL